VTLGLVESEQRNSLHKIKIRKYLIAAAKNLDDFKLKTLYQFHSMIFWTKSIINVHGVEGKVNE
jgi:hypothetical protein